MVSLVFFTDFVIVISPNCSQHFLVIRTKIRIYRYSDVSYCNLELNGGKLWVVMAWGQSKLGFLTQEVNEGGGGLRVQTMMYIANPSDSIVIPTPEKVLYHVRR